MTDRSEDEAPQEDPIPGKVAWEWLEAIKAQDRDHVWRLMDPDFRLAMAQYWIVHNEEVLREPSVIDLGRDTFARELSREAPIHQLWEHCGRVSLREITDTCGGLVHEDLLIGTRPRVIGPDLELIRFFPKSEMWQDEDGNYYFAPGQAVMGISVIVRYRDPRWLIASIGDRLYRPGWPPKPERVVWPED